MIENLNEKDIMICDRIFKGSIAADRIKVNFVCGWKKPRNRELEEWKKRENKELSQQRGSFERHIGRLVNKFKIIRKKYRTDTKDIKDIMLFIMSIHNIENHLDLIKKYLLNDVGDFEEYITLLQSYFGEEIVDIITLEELRRRREEEEAYEHEESISNFLLRFESEINEEAPSNINIISHQAEPEVPISSLISDAMLDELFSDIPNINATTQRRTRVNIRKNAFKRTNVRKRTSRKIK